MFASLQESERDFVVRIRRRRDRSRVDELSKLIERFGRSRAVFFCNRVRPRKIDIVDGSKVRYRNFRIQPRMIASDMANANDTDAQFFHLATFFKNQS